VLFAQHPARLNASGKGAVGDKRINNVHNFYCLL
jgi:hypothetical protein